MVRLPDSDTAPEAEVVLSKAVVRAAEQLGVKQTQLARMLGLSPATASRLTAGSWRLAPESKSWELALAFVRLYRDLSAITGGASRTMRDWLRSGTDALGAPPLERMLTAEGLVSVLQYLDAARGRV